MFKNVASQKIAFFSFDYSTGAPKTGDAANMTAYVNKDWGGVTVLGDTSATELDSTNAKGWYSFDLTQAETNADALLFTCKSSTANVSVVGALIFTTPASFTSSVAQTGDSFARIGANGIGLVAAGAILTGTAQGGSASTIQLAAATSTADDNLNGALVFIISGTGAGQAGRFITDWVSATDTATVSPDWTTQPDNTSVYAVIPSAPATTAAGSLPKVDVDTIKTNPVVNGGTITFPSNATLASTTNITAGTITTTTNLTNAPTNGDFTATMKTSAQTAAAAALTAYDPPTKAELDAAVAPLATSAEVGNLPTNAEAAALLDDRGITEADGITRIAGVDVQQGGTGGQSVGA